MNRKTGISGLMVIITFFIFACASQSGITGAHSGEGIQNVSAFSPELPVGIETLNAAKADMAALLKNRKRPFLIEFGKRFHAQQGPGGLIWQDAWKDLNRGINNDLVELDFYNLEARSLKYLVLRNLPFQDDKFRIYPSIYIPLEGFYDFPLSFESGLNAKFPYEVGVREWILFKFSRMDMADAQKFANDLYFIQQWNKKESEHQLSEFEQVALKYRALDIKPAMSEEQRKYIVQANAFNQHKDYTAAIDHYIKAIDLDPVSYPGAYFNLALLSAQLDRYIKAINYMKQYLMLVPDAKDARSAQDKIYEWESIIETR